MAKPILIGVNRDGTINFDPGYFGRDENWKRQIIIHKGVVEGIQLLNTNNLVKIIVATNQNGVAR